MTIATTTERQTILTDEQYLLLCELRAMGMFRKDQTYLWYMDQLADEGIGTVEAWEERYHGCFENGLDSGMDNAGAEFAQQLAEECGELPDLTSSWIQIDWKASWENLKYDYTTIEIPAESGHGYIQETHFFHNY